MSAVSEYIPPPLRRGMSGLARPGPSRALSTAETVVNFGHALTFRTTSIRRFQCYFLVSLLLNLFYVICELMALRVAVAAPGANTVGLVLLLISIFFSLLDTVAFVLLIFRRSRNLCVAAFLCILTTDIIYATQLAQQTAKFSKVKGYYISFLVGVLFLTLQVFPLIVTYRFDVPYAT